MSTIRHSEPELWRDRARGLDDELSLREDYWLMRRLAELVRRSRVPERRVPFAPTPLNLLLVAAG